LRREQPSLAAAGLQVVMIGLGTPDEAQAFRASLRLPFTLLCDTEMLSYARYGLGRMTVGAEASLSSARALVSEITRYGGAWSQDQDMGQLGGVFVVDTTGRVRLGFRPRRAHDRPPVADLVRAIQG